MAAATRFFSESFNESDPERPVVEFKLASQPKVGDTEVEFSIKMSDNEGLQALVCLQRGGEWIDALVGEADLEGQKSFNRTVKFTCPRALGPSQPVIYILNVMDVNGNLAQAQLTSGVAPK